MIRYALRCASGHEFESWFASIAGYEALAKAGHLACAVCGSGDVERGIMAPAVARSDRGGPAYAKGAAEGGAMEPAAVSVGAAGGDNDGDAAWSNRREILARLKQLRDDMLAKSEYVGPRFAEEARIIHEQTADGEPARAIHGEASAEDVRELLEDGIPVAPIPQLPRDEN